MKTPARLLLVLAIVLGITALGHQPSQADPTQAHVKIVYCADPPSIRNGEAGDGLNVRARWGGVQIAQGLTNSNGEWSFDFEPEESGTLTLEYLGNSYTWHTFYFGVTVTPEPPSSLPDPWEFNGGSGDGPCPEGASGHNATITDTDF